MQGQQPIDQPRDPFTFVLACPGDVEPSFLDFGSELWAVDFAPEPPSVVIIGFGDFLEDIGYKWIWIRRIASYF